MVASASIEAKCTPLSLERAVLPSCVRVSARPFAVPVAQGKRAVVGELVCVVLEVERRREAKNGPLRTVLALALW